MQLLNHRSCMYEIARRPAGRPADKMYGVSVWQHTAEEHGGKYIGRYSVLCK